MGSVPGSDNVLYIEIVDLIKHTCHMFFDNVTDGLNAIIIFVSRKGRYILFTYLSTHIATDYLSALCINEANTVNIKCLITAIKL